MKTLSEYFKRDSRYWGERSKWLVAYATTRDADCLGRSNWECFVRHLSGKRLPHETESAEIAPGVAIEVASHWACGWVQYLLVNPAHLGLVSRAEKALKRLDGYPVFDENHWSTLEFDEYLRSFNDDASSAFRRAFKDDVSDAALDLIENAEPSNLIEWFEALTPSGDYQSDGYPRFETLEKATRDDLAKLLRTLRAA